MVIKCILAEPTGLDKRRYGDLIEGLFGQACPKCFVEALTCGFLSRFVSRSRHVPSCSLGSGRAIAYLMRHGV